MSLVLPKRTEKPRTYGLTCVHDVMLSRGELGHILEDFNEFIDVAKLGVGSAYVYPRLAEKVELYQSNGVKVYFGGTLFEKFYHQDKLEDYAQFMKDSGVKMVEVSMGTVDISLEKRIEIIKFYQDKGFDVLSEVGTKDGEAIMAPSTWVNEIQQLLDVGCHYVITEGRNSGTAGLYRPSGELRTGLIDDIISTFDTKRLIFEAPTPKSQMFFINKVGANVNLGNVNPRQLLLLEAQRQGLRSETFYLESE